ncbi:hypothetical protein Y032_0014g2486 [Ancylostoma ceylanicum]|uniref:Uncharacterized protein n=1 Tax=Ancylostoma ceylanicum TaxID=53326 RepID=A0A016VAD1_9BILA|nr:hypothetical protein Y032_0014g2486 [Ancylostoma ceylanicum]
MKISTKLLHISSGPTNELTLHMATSLVKISSRGVRSLHPLNFRAPWPFVKKGAFGQRKIGPFHYEKFKWPGQNREFPELSPKWHKENPKELHR